MFNSIRWTLQLWHAGLLAVVLAGFGVTSYYGAERMRYQEVDAELERSVQILAGSLRPPHPHGEPELRQRPRRDDRPSSQPDDRSFFDPGGPRDRYPGRPGPEGPRAAFGVPEIDLPPEMTQLFGDPDAGRSYYVIWNFQGEVLRSSALAIHVPDPGGPVSMGPPIPEPPRIRQRGEWRESYIFGPFGLRLLVGRSVQREQVALRHLAILLTATGAGVLLVGLVGGAILSSRVVRPIRAMTAVAQEISASNLSRRIDISETQSELGTLAAVLNDTFARLEAAFQRQVRFTADASHELRTPLAVIHTHAQLALSRSRTPEEYRKTIEACLRASVRMKDLVDSLLLLARADAGRLALLPVPFDLRELVEECVGMVAPLAAKRGIAIDTHGEELELTADPSRIAQVVTNLLTNAIRYNHDGGRVDVSIRRDGDAALFEVADTGIGIPEEHQSHLFERFYRVDAARSREDGGSGLGLAICRSIVAAHGGAITFRSTPDHGATFVVRLPCAGAEPPASLPAASRPATDAPLPPDSDLSSGS